MHYLGQETSGIFEVTNNSYSHVVIAEAIALAKKKKRFVTFRFNDVVLVVGPDSDFESVFALLSRELDVRLRAYVHKELLPPPSGNDLLYGEIKRLYEMDSALVFACVTAFRFVEAINVLGVNIRRGRVEIGVYVLRADGSFLAMGLHCFGWLSAIERPDRLHEAGFYAQSLAEKYAVRNDFNVPY